MTIQPRHSFNEHPAVTFKGHRFSDGNDRIVKSCARCLLKKVTVHPKGNRAPWNEYISRDGKLLRECITPPCIPVSPDLEEARDWHARTLPHARPAIEPPSASLLPPSPFSRESTGRTG